MRKIALFDLDGTLLETREDLAEGANYALKALGYPARSTDEVRAFVGNGLHNLMEKALPETAPAGEADRMLEVFMPYYMEHCADRTRPYPGIPELLARLKAAGWRLAVLSNKGDAAVQKLIGKFFPDTFEAVLGERKDIRRKPAPDAVFEVLRQLQAGAEEAVYIGDSEVDIATADNAGLPGCIVTWGFRSREQLQEAGAKRLADSTEELLEQLEKA